MKPLPLLRYSTRVESSPGRPVRRRRAGDSAVPGFTGHLEVNHVETLVRAIGLDGVGGWYVGGEFLRVDGRYARRSCTCGPTAASTLGFVRMSRGLHALALDREQGSFGWAGTSGACPEAVRASVGTDRSASTTIASRGLGSAGVEVLVWDCSV